MPACKCNRPIKTQWGLACFDCMTAERPFTKMYPKYDTGLLEGVTLTIDSVVRDYTLYTTPGIPFYDCIYIPAVTGTTTRLIRLEDISAEARQPYNQDKKAEIHDFIDECANMLMDRASLNVARISVNKAQFTMQAANREAAYYQHPQIKNNRHM